MLVITVRKLTSKNIAVLQSEVQNHELYPTKNIINQLAIACMLHDLF
jgi:hypothetical protein